MNIWKPDGANQPIKSWATDLDDKTIAQATNLASLPFLAGPVCLMPDAHMGYGMPIGGVLATTECVIPNAVGVDIGCGMLAARFAVDYEAVEAVEHDMMEELDKRIPRGFTRHTKPQTHRMFLTPPRYEPILADFETAQLQLGTLGGGNHFIELQHDDADSLWVMIHSGSRHLGKTVAEFYNKKAIALNAAFASKVPEEWELAFLPFGTDEASEYMGAMGWCMRYASENRAAMMLQVEDALTTVLGRADRVETIETVHNYAETRRTRLHGPVVAIHRKGAVKAKGGVLIPGSMGSHSYIGTGLDNPASYSSCSHGAGRAMGRREAIRSLGLDTEYGLMQKAGVTVDSKSDIREECSAAYKDIEVVMDAQADLVQRLEKLTPFAVLKG